MLLSKFPGFRVRLRSRYMGLGALLCPSTASPAHGGGCQPAAAFAELSIPFREPLSLRRLESHAHPYRSHT